MEQTPLPNLRRIKIDNTDIFLEDFEKGQGKIIISNTYGQNYSTYWGSMGDDMSSFLKSINSDYFANRLLGSQDSQVMDVKKTFREIRKYIREDIGLKWYQHQDFQMSMRERINYFQGIIASEPNERYFIDIFNSYFIEGLDFWKIDDSYEEERIKRAFNDICEPWDFIQKKPSPQYEWLTKLHTELKKVL